MTKPYCLSNRVNNPTNKPYSLIVWFLKRGFLPKNTQKPVPRLTGKIPLFGSLLLAGGSTKSHLIFLWKGQRINGHSRF